MQKWEYAYILWQQGEWDNQSWINLVKYHPRREETKLVEGGLLKKSPDWLGQLGKWVTELGQEGYEMVGLMGSEKGPFTMKHYWFKRPLPVSETTADAGTPKEIGAPHSEPLTWSDE